MTTTAYSYILESEHHVYHVRSYAKLTQGFLNFLQEATDKPWEAVRSDKEIPSHVPFCSIIPVNKTFNDYKKAIAEFYNTCLYMISDSVPQGNNLIMYHGPKGRGVAQITDDDKLLLVSQAFPVKIQRMLSIEPTEQFKTWFNYHRVMHFESAEQIQTMLDILQPPDKVPVIHSKSKEIQTLKSYDLPYVTANSYDGEWNAAEISIVSAMSGSKKADLYKLKVVQVVLVKEFVCSTKFATAPRTSDITTQFNTHIKTKYAIDDPVQEIGTHLKCLGYINKRTAQGYVWPELAEWKLPSLTVVKEHDLFTGSAPLFSGL